VACYPIPFRTVPSHDVRRAVAIYRFLGRRSDPSGLIPGRWLTSPDSNLRTDAASPPDLTAEVTIRANAHTEKYSTVQYSTVQHIIFYNEVK